MNVSTTANHDARRQRRVAMVRRYTWRTPARLRRLGSPSMPIKLLIVLFLIVIVYNLFAGLFYMMTDKGKTNRTVRALTWRIGLSVFLILLVVLGIMTGVIQPHGLGR
jgi:succinate dehydrogenase/fumarate reductase cytochrome b subunit